MNANNNCWVIDKDCCPKKDIIIMQDLCGGCSHYNGFEIVNGERCIKCDYYITCDHSAE